MPNDACRKPSLVRLLLFSYYPPPHLTGKKHGRERWLVVEECLQVPDHEVTELGARLLGEDGLVRGEHHVVYGEELRGHLGLLLEDVQARARYLPSLQCPDQRHIVDVSSA